VPEEIEKVYIFATLSQYSLKQRILIHLADWTFFILIRLIGATVRFETQGTEHLQSIEAKGKLPIYAVWHDRIFLGTYHLRNQGIVFLTSQSFDGEYIARFLQRFGYGAIRGSSTRGGAKGLVEMIRGMKRRLPMGFTVDGPKGPRHEAKSGAVLLAKKTGNPVLPFILQPRRFWTLNSWDKLQIPRPFTRAVFIYGRPITVEADAPDEQVKIKTDELQAELDELVNRGNKWSKEA
jgi:lysophospholipid acyltransferase (LPLAT)-like uncharacterized protein